MNRSRRRIVRSGFTLVELLVSMVVLIVLVVLLTQLINTLRGVISRTTTSIEEFRGARDAFETMARRIGQATLNSYDDVNPTISGTASRSGTAYVRASELRFISGDAATLLTGTYSGKSLSAGQEYPSAPYPTDAVFFQAPLGVTQAASASAYAPLTQLLNTCGYYIKWDNDKDLRPSFLSSTTIPYRWRFHLMELIEPTENLRIYSVASTGGGTTGTSGPSSTSPTRSASWDYASTDWFTYPVVSESASSVHVLAENIVFLSILPMVAPQNAIKGDNNPASDGTSTDLVGSNYLYDTTPDLAASGVKYRQNNQLPPIVYLMMIAVDEKSFARYLGAATAAPTDLGLAQILVNPTYDQRQRDIKQVTDALTSHKIGYRIFTLAIPLGAH